MSTCGHEQILDRLRAEYREMPDKRLKLEQVQRLCGIEPPLCKRALEELVEARFLRLGSDGTYVLFGSQARRARHVCLLPGGR
jgi:DNA-binding IclR family transcriptional regulator